jgi:hypothetical protein
MTNVMLAWGSVTCLLSVWAETVQYFVEVAESEGLKIV